MNAPIDQPIDPVGPQTTPEHVGSESPARTIPGSHPPPPPEGRKERKECRPDQTPWWKHLLELAAVLLGIAVACIYWKQLAVMSGQLEMTRKQLDDAENVQAARLTIENFELKVVPGDSFTVEGSYDVKNVGVTVATEISIGFEGHGGRGSIDKMAMGKSTITPSPDGFSLGQGSVRHFATGRAGNGTVAEVVSGIWTDTYEIEVGYRDIFNRPHIVTDCLVYHSFKGHDFEPCPFFHQHE
jgi:hypothetical protein